MFGQAVVPHLLKTAKKVLSQPPSPDRPNPTLILTGATMSLKSGANFSAMAPGMFARRAIAQSLAREFGPQGLHVAHVVIDGMIDTPSARERGGEDKDEKVGDRCSAVEILRADLKRMRVEDIAEVSKRPCRNSQGLFDNTIDISGSHQAAALGVDARARHPVGHMSFRQDRR